MALTEIIAYSVHCDVCRQLFDDEENGNLFLTVATANDTARTFGWTVLGPEYVCPVRDQAHQDRIDAHMPPEPVMQVLGQLDLSGGEEP